MKVTEQVFRYLDDGKTTLVFPTENACRHFLTQYVIKRKKSIPASRAMAFDSFKMLFAPVHEKKPANKYHRLAFVANFLDSGKTGLRYLYKDDFYGYRQRFVRFITSALLSLAEADNVKFGSRELFRDMSILKSAYADYLEKYGLFEPGWEKHSLKYAADKEKSYVLVGYEADIQMQTLTRELGEAPNIKILEIQGSENAVYEKFLTEEAEIEALFRRLKHLKDSGVRADDIIISTPGLETLQARLERKAVEYNVPLSFMKSVKLTDTTPGRYLFAVRRCINEGLSFGSLENLLLNSAMPYKRMDLNRALIRFMIDYNRISGSTDFKCDSLLSELANKAKDPDGNKELPNYYKGLKSAAAAISRASDGDELIKAIQGLTSLLMEGEQFGAGEAFDKDVYSFIIGELTQMSRQFNEVGLPMRGGFSLFMGELENLSYVSQEKREGIRVYQYGQDQLMYVPYHFLFGLNEANCEVKSSSVGFLEDHEVSSRLTYDVTDSILSFYRSSGDNVYISGSEVSYEGAQSIPSFFMKKGAVKKSSFVFEDIVEKADAVSLETAKQTAFAPKGADYTREKGKPWDINRVQLSYSSIDRYATCPYKAYLAMSLTHDAPGGFEPAVQDDLAIGSFLHGCIQKFMENHFSEFLVPGKLDSYNAELDKILDSGIEENDKFDPYTGESIKAKYRDALKAVISGLLADGAVGSFMPLENEYELNSDPSFRGFIDTIIQDKKGDIFLLDYKKGKGKPTYQLVLYKRLYEKKPPFGAGVKDCFFYSMEERKFKGFDEEKWREQSELLDENIEKIRTGYSEGDWIAAPNKNNCAQCEERGLCRRRFNLL
ncbi:MAG: PD-(D/E)XK nuclease family protein [Sphaerochaeta sp.]